MNAQLHEGRQGQQQLGIRHQVTDADLQAVEVIGAPLTVGAHRRPEMTHVLHRAQLELLLHPLDVVLVVEEQGHLLRGERELEPTLGMGTGDLPIHKGRTGAQGQE